ncbi:MAG: serine/threonine protein kinase [Planctomycetes bacterium]|nr:serine/threonine protein kinase [Planctomycetota bacterium]
MPASSARQQAILEVGRRRGLVRGDVLDRLLAEASGAGLTQSLHSVLGPGQLELLHDAARRTRFACPRGCVLLGFDDLATMAALACPRCATPLTPDGEAPASRPVGPPHPAAGAPRVIGGYEVVAELGRGAFGVVYEVRRPGLERAFALKVLLRAGEDPELLARFRLEAQVASKLHHPGVVGVFDAGQHGELPFLVMELCHGQTLRDRLRRGPLAPVDAARLVAEVARAVAFAHGHGVLHRDLKPANIIIDASTGRPRVTDFGLARDRSLARSMTRTGDVVGTPAYAAPEQLRGERGLDARVDVYALGVVLYECLTGERPFVGADVVSLAEQVLHGPLRPPRALTPGVPGALEEACLRALARERFQRTPTASALADELEAAVASSVEAPAGRASERRRGAPAALTSGPGRGGWAAGAAAALVGAAVLVGWAAWPSPSPAPPPVAPGSEVAEPPREPPPLTPPTTSEPTPAPVPARLSDDEAARLTDATFRALMFNEQRQPTERDAVELLFAQAPALAAAYPEDGRAVFAGAFARLLRGELDEVVARRDLVRAFALDPPADGRLRDRAARLCFHLGFQRAAADLLEPLVAGARAPEPRGVLDLTVVLAKAEPPVRDAARALQLAHLAAELADADRGGPRGRRGPDQPRAWEVRILLAQLLLFHGDKGAAVQAFRDAADRTRWRGYDEQLRADADRLEASPGLPLGHDVPLRQVPYYFGLGKFLAAWGQHLEESEARGQDHEGAAKLEELARQERPLAPARAALLLLAAARAFERGGAPPEVLRCLEEAAALTLPADAGDVTSLVRRRLARAVLRHGSGAEAARRAERLALDAAAAADHPACTPGERADAWVLVGEARRAAGDEAGAAEAAARAAALRPSDVRGVEALRRPALPGQAEDLEALLADAAGVIRLNGPRMIDDAAAARLRQRAPALAARVADDGRAAYLVGLAELLRGGDELEARRGLLRGLARAPDLPDVLRDRAARLNHALGFERAAADLLEPTFADRTPDPEQGLCLVQVYMKSAPPVVHVQRSVDLLGRTLAARALDPRDGDALMPPTWDLHANLGELRLFLKDVDGAVRAYRDALAATRDPRARAFFQAHADDLQRSGADPTVYDVPGRRVAHYFPANPFLLAVAEARRTADGGDDRRAAEALVALAGREQGERAALARLAAARLLDRIGDRAAAAAALEPAVALALPARSSDVRALVARSLGRLLLARDPARAEALGLEAAQAPQDPPLTAGERADAWALVGLVRRQRGDAAGAREAAERGAALRPHDRRELDALLR